MPGPASVASDRNVTLSACSRGHGVPGTMARRPSTRDAPVAQACAAARAARAGRASRAGAGRAEMVEGCGRKSGEDRDRQRTSSGGEVGRRSRRRENRESGANAFCATE